MSDSPPPAADGATGDGDLDRWLSDARADDAVRERARQRALRLQAEEEATFVGVLVDLAERSEPVVVHVAWGGPHRGAVSGVARDFVALRAPEGTTTFVALRAVSSVRLLPRAPSGDTASDRDSPTALSLAALLADAAAERLRAVLVVDGDGATISGELRAAGTDVLTVRVDGDPPTTAYVPLTSLVSVSLRG